MGEKKPNAEWTIWVEIEKWLKEKKNGTELRVAADVSPIYRRMLNLEKEFVEAQASNSVDELKKLYDDFGNML